MIAKRLWALLFASLGWAAVGAAQAEPATWPNADAAAPVAQDLRGWDCAASFALPASTRQIAACRRTGPRASAELRLLLVERRHSKPPQLTELARLRDASQVHMRMFTSPVPCPKDVASCLAAIVLLDQRDESSCYGTQVVIVPVARPVRAIGFIDEVRGGDDAGACSGPWASVDTVPGGARVSLPAPLMKEGRGGGLEPLSVPAVRYRIDAMRPVLKREPPAAL